MALRDIVKFQYGLEIASIVGIGMDELEHDVKEKINDRVIADVVEHWRDVKDNFSSKTNIENRQHISSYTIEYLMIHGKIPSNYYYTKNRLWN